MGQPQPPYYTDTQDSRNARRYDYVQAKLNESGPNPNPRNAANLGAYDQMINMWTRGGLGSYFPDRPMPRPNFSQNQQLYPGEMNSPTQQRPNSVSFGGTQIMRQPDGTIRWTNPYMAPDMVDQMNQGDPMALRNAAHEMVHANQDIRSTSQLGTATGYYPWPVSIGAEGGDDAFLNRVFGPILQRSAHNNIAVQNRLNSMPGLADYVSNPYATQPNTGYGPLVAQVNQTQSPWWIMHGQFQSPSTKPSVPQSTQRAAGLAAKKIPIKIKRK